MIKVPIASSPMDRNYMLRALELAERGWGRVHPNPLVGAVVVRDNVIVGEGYHSEYGGPHAEVHALEAAGPKASGATMYVTLEPCSHEGKTPPCINSIGAAGIKRVVFGARDPHSQAAGGGDRLRSSGLDVVGGVLEEEVRRQNAAYFHAIEHGSPFIMLKYALSLDARLGESATAPTLVTGPRARAEVHRLRAGFDSIMVGVGTVITDDPLLTVRGTIVPRRAPIRVILDTEARMPLHSRLLGDPSGSAPVMVVCAEDAAAARLDSLQGAGACVVTVRRGRDRRLALDAVLDQLWSEGVRSIFCEGGACLGSALLAYNLVQRLCLFYAPRFFGESGPTGFPAEPSASMQAGWRLCEVRELDDDVQMLLDRER